MGLLATALLAVSVLGSSELSLLSAQGDCEGAVTLETAPGEASAIALGPLAATADHDTPRARRFCAVRVRLDVPVGFTARFDVPHVTGELVQAAGGSGHVSVRWFAAGELGEQWSLAVRDGATEPGPFTVAPGDWRTPWHRCGEPVDMTLLVDLTARLRDAAEGERQVVAIERLRFPPVLYKRCE